MGKKVSIGNMVGITCRSCPQKVFLGKGVLNLCRKFTGEHP